MNRLTLTDLLLNLMLALALALVGSIGFGAATAGPARAARAETEVLRAAGALRPIDQAGWNARKRRVRLPNGIELAYVELGNPRGRPVLLLHGYTDTSRVWSIVAPYLSEYQLLIPDQRGHGASTAPACCYGLSSFVEDARLFLDAMDVERATIVGSSLGSMVAQVFAAEHPDRVDRIILSGSTALVPIRRGDWMWTNTQDPARPAPANAAFLRELSAGASPTAVDADFVRLSDVEMAAVPLHVWRAVLRELVDVPAGRYAPDVRAEVGILSGGRDPLFPAEHHRALVAAYPRAQAHVFGDLGHNLVVERPHEVGPVLAGMLRERMAARAN